MVHEDGMKANSKLKLLTDTVSSAFEPSPKSPGFLGFLSFLSLLSVGVSGEDLLCKFLGENWMKSVLGFGVDRLSAEA
jgi:hypothetical protein